MSHFVPEARPYLNPVADVVSLVPLFGDMFALGYYGTQASFDCAAGRCDPVAIGINLGGSIPIVGDLGKAVKYGGMGIGFLGLVTKTGRGADDVSSGLAAFFRRADELAPPGGIFDTTARRLQRFGVPDSVVRQLDRSGNLRSLGFYDELGRLHKRIDVTGAPHFIPGHGRVIPHVQEFVWRSGGPFRGYGFEKIYRPVTYWEEILIRAYR